MSCPICKKPTDKTYRPFCSKRCADIDLGNWVGERYVVPTDEPADGLTDAPDSDTSPDRLH
jgi:endogenous inhibitor of DNA gyrase (YacG/DUF329 family)